MRLRTCLMAAALGTSMQLAAIPIEDLGSFPLEGTLGLDVPAEIQPLLAAEEAIRNGDLDSAAEVLALFLEMDQENAAAWELDGVVKSIQGDLAGAATSLERAMALAPEAPDPFVKRGIVAAANGERTRAMGFFRRALELRPDHSLARIKLAEIASDEGRHRRVIELLEPMSSSLTPDQQAMLGSAYLEIDDLDRARKMVVQIEQAAPDHVAGLVMRGIAARMAGDVDESVALLEQAVAKDEDNGPIRLQLGRSLAAAQRYDDAIRELEAASSEQSDRSVVDGEIARVHWAAGRERQAIRTMESAVERSGAASAYQLLSRFQMSMGNASAAVTTARKYVAAHPNIESSYLTLAQILFANGDESAGLDTLARGSKKLPKSLALSLQSGMRHHQAGDHKAAAAAYEATLAQAPDNMLALNNLASLKASQGDAESALAYASRAHELAPDDPSVQETLGWAHYLNGDLANSSRLLGLAVPKLTESWSAQCHHGIVLAEAGDSSARRVLRRCVEMSPENDGSLKPRALQALADLSE